MIGVLLHETVEDGVQRPGDLLTLRLLQTGAAGLQFHSPQPPIFVSKCVPFLPGSFGYENPMTLSYVGLDTDQKHIGKRCTGETGEVLLCSAR